MKLPKLAENYDGLVVQALGLYSLYTSTHQQELYWRKKYLDNKLMTPGEVHRQLEAERDTNHKLTQLLEEAGAEIERLKQ